MVSNPFKNILIKSAIHLIHLKDEKRQLDLNREIEGHPINSRNFFIM